VCPRNTDTVLGPVGDAERDGGMVDDGHRPMMSAEYAATLRRWHEAASIELHRDGAREVCYLGLELEIPEQVFPPMPMSDLLGRAVLDDVPRRRLGARHGHRQRRQRHPRSHPIP
jgi:hypothetical protein